MLKSCKLFFMPASVYACMRDKGLTNEEMGKFNKDTLAKIPPSEIAYLEAINDHSEIKSRLFSTFLPVFKLDSEAEYQFWQGIRRDTNSASIEARLQNECGGDATTKSPFTIILGSDDQVIVIFGSGSLEALKKENNVLELIKAIIQKALAFNTLPVVMGSNYALARRYISLSARIGAMRSPAPVFS